MQVIQVSSPINQPKPTNSVGLIEPHRLAKFNCNELLRIVDN